MVIMSAICPLWVKKLGCRCKSVLGGVFEWLTIACRIGVPAGLTMIGAWMNEYCLLDIPHFLRRQNDGAPINKGCD